MQAELHTSRQTLQELLVLSTQQNHEASTENGWSCLSYFNKLSRSSGHCSSAHSSHVDEELTHHVPAPHVLAWSSDAAQPSGKGGEQRQMSKG